MSAWAAAWRWSAPTSACPSCWWPCSRSSCSPGCASASPRWPWLHWVRRRDGEAPLSPARPLAAVLGKLSRQLPVLDLHALRRGADLGGGCRRGDGGHPRGGGAAVAHLPRRAHPPARADGHRAGRHRHRAAGAEPARRWRRRGRRLGLGLPAAAGRGAVRGQLRGHRQAPHRPADAAAHQRADQPVGPGAGHAAGPVAGAALRLRQRRRRPPGCCWCSMRLPPAW